MSTPHSTTFRVANILVGCIQNVCFGGIIYGTNHTTSWKSLSQSIPLIHHLNLSTHLIHHSHHALLPGWSSISGALLLAKPTEGGPGLSHEYIQVMFATATFFNFLSPLFLGIILDAYGPRTCSVLSFFIITLGCALFSISNIPNLPLFAPAMSLIAFGGPGVQSAIIHLSNLFPGSKSTATALITGSFQLSFIVFFLFDQIWFEFGIGYQVRFSPTILFTHSSGLACLLYPLINLFTHSASLCLSFFYLVFQTLFLGFGCLSFINMAISMTLWPDEPYHYDEDDHNGLPLTIWYVGNVHETVEDATDTMNEMMIY